MQHICYGLEISKKLTTTKLTRWQLVTAQYKRNFKVLHLIRFSKFAEPLFTWFFKLINSANPTGWFLVELKLIWDKVKDKRSNLKRSYSVERVLIAITCLASVGISSFLVSFEHKNSNSVHWLPLIPTGYQVSTFHLNSKLKLASVDNQQSVDLPACLSFDFIVISWI